MKNLFIALGAIALLGATSCKKDYTCECTTKVEFAGVTSEASAKTTIKDTKKKATDACEAGSRDVTGGSVKCVIK